MASSGSSGAAPPSGVVQSSALSFVSAAQPKATADNVSAVPGPSREMDRVEMEQADQNMVPAGVAVVCEACAKVYPDQPNPLQVTTRLKYWLGGLDPLDYISMYWNPGKPEQHIPQHWHYVSFGLSDLHGDRRVHFPAAGSKKPSGYGFELTMRLSAEGATQPPLWPAALLQAIARYVFSTGNKLCAGDHISWHQALDGSSQGRLRHMLVAADPQLERARGPYGTVTFLQVVGCTGRELKAAQLGSGFEVLKIIGEDPNCGGSWLVTRIARRASARGVRRRPNAYEHANLAGVSAKLRWHVWWQPTEPHRGNFNFPPGVSLEDMIKKTLERGLLSMHKRNSGPEGHMSTESFEMSDLVRALPNENSWRDEGHIQYLEGVHIIMNAEAASLLPLAINGRVRHGSHFTWRGDMYSLTVMPPDLPGAFASLRSPRVSVQVWLQLVITEDLIEELSKQVACFLKFADTDSEPDSEDETLAMIPPTLPVTLTFPKHKIKISVVPDNDFLEPQQRTPACCPEY